MVKYYILFFEVNILSDKNKIVKYSNPMNFNIGVVIFFIIIFYVLFNIFSYFTKTHIAEYQVQQGTIASNYIFQGIIIRDETIEYAPRKGFINYYVKNASKISVNDIVYSIDTEGTISNQISSSGEKENAISNETLTSLASGVNGFIKDYNGNKFSESYTFFNNLNSEIAQSINLNALANLSSKVNKAENNNTFYKYSSPEDGVIVYEVDGFEEYSIEDIISSEIDYSIYKEMHLFSKNQVEKNAPVYKRVNSENWNIIVPITEKLAKELNGRTSLKIRFCKDDYTVDTACSIVRKEDRYYINFSLIRGMVRYINDRFVDIEIIMSDDTGLKIPQSAITSKEFYTIPKKYFTLGGDSSNPGLLVKQKVNREESVKLIIPTLYYETDEFYYIDNELVSEGDIVLMSDSSSTYTIGTDKSSLVGVYNINKGYAVFKQINIIYENEAYAIIETKTAYGISLYDHIALNAAEVKENQLTSK